MVTADGGMTQLVRNHKLSATDCRLVQLPGDAIVHEAVEGALAVGEGV